MTIANQIKKSDDFNLVVIFRIEGKNSREIVLKAAGFVAALVAVAVKVAIWLQTRGN